MPRLAVRPYAEAMELTKRECEEVLERNGLGRLGCYSPRDGESYIIPVAYGYHFGSIYLALVPGQKLRYLTEHPMGVCFEVEEISNGSDWITVVAVGDFSRLQPEEPDVKELRRGALRPVFDIGLAPFPPDAQVLGKLTVRKLTGQHDRRAELVTAP